MDVGLEREMAALQWVVGHRLIDRRRRVVDQYVDRPAETVDRLGDETLPIIGLRDVGDDDRRAGAVCLTTRCGLLQ